LTHFYLTRSGPTPISQINSFCHPYIFVHATLIKKERFRFENVCFCSLIKRYIVFNHPIYVFLYVKKPGVNICLFEYFFILRFKYWCLMINRMNGSFRLWDWFKPTRWLSWLQVQELWDLNVIINRMKWLNYFVIVSILSGCIWYGVITGQELISF